MAVILAAVCAILFFLLLLLVFYYARHVRRRDIFYRLRRYRILEEGKEARRESIFLRARKLLSRVAAPLEERGPVRALDLRMRRAGVPLLGGEFLVALLAGGLLAGIGTWMLTLDSFFSILAGSLVAFALWATVSYRIRRRRTAFTEQLGDCLSTVANALRAGYSFQQAMEVVAQEMEPPISQEFAEVNREVAMSVPLETALEAMNQRVGSADFDLVVTSVLIQREVGGNLAQILDTIGDTIQERIRMKREILALTAQGRLSAWILILLPFALGTFMYFFNREQIMLLFTEPIGQVAVAVTFVLEIIGYIVIQRIVNIDT